MAGGRGWPKIGASWLGGSPGSELEAPALFFLPPKIEEFTCVLRMCALISPGSEKNSI
jgi:hypothetical protein